jgi:hypothetical protein
MDIMRAKNKKRKKTGADKTVMKRRVGVKIAP